MRCLIIVCLVFIMGFALADDLGTRTDKSGQFTYRIPPGWRVTPGEGRHDVLKFIGGDDKVRNILIAEQPGSSSWPRLQAAYERDLAKALPGFQLISSTILQHRGEDFGVRIIHLNHGPGIQVRQVNYVIPVGPKRLFIAVTLLPIDQAKFDSALNKFASSFAWISGKQ